MADFLERESKPEGSSRKVHISSLFHALIQGLAPIWPVRNQLDGVSLGDVWPCSVLALPSGTPEHVKGNLAETGLPRGLGDDLVPFHKLTQWLTYSLVEPIENILGWKVEGMEDMTGLPEYRNGMNFVLSRDRGTLLMCPSGGLLVDIGVLSLRKETVSSFYPDPTSGIPRLPPSHPAIIEWRAMTVIEL